MIALVVATTDSVELLSRDSHLASGLQQQSSVIDREGRIVDVLISGSRLKIGFQEVPLGFSPPSPCYQDVLFLGLLALL